MTALDTPTARIAEIDRIKARLGTNSDRRILDALGHPGYGGSFAANALQQWIMRPGVSLHAIVYGTAPIPVDDSPVGKPTGWPFDDRSVGR